MCLHNERAFLEGKAVATAIGGSPARDLFQTLKFNPISWNLSRLVVVDPTEPYLTLRPLLLICWRACSRRLRVNVMIVGLFAQLINALEKLAGQLGMLWVSVEVV